MVFHKQKMEIDNCDTSLEVLIKEFSGLNKEDPIVVKNCVKIEAGIRTGNYTILQLVEELGSLLVDHSSLKRELGVEILTQVIEKLENRSLSADQLRFIATFYADRLKDHHQVIPPVIRGILALLKFDHLPDGLASEMINSLHINVPCQQQQCTDRHNIYLIFQVALENKRQEMKNMGLDFVYGVISAMDGERDPRNLLLLFNWLPTFLHTVTLGHLCEEMFETIACYFPVDFRAPTQDINSISRKMLADSLCPCLCAVPSFAEFCLPLAIEKLDSSLRIAKLDSLNLLKEGCKTFEAKSYQENCIVIWSLIYKELLQCNDNELETACLNTLTTYIAKLSTNNDNTFKLHLNDIIDTLKGNLLPDSKLFEVTTKILLHIAKASQPSADIIAKSVIPILTNTYNITVTPSSQARILKVLVEFSKAFNDVFNGIGGPDVEELKQIPVLCVAALTDKNYEVMEIGWNSINAVVNALSEPLRESLFETVMTNIVELQTSNLRELILVCFKTLAINFPEDVENRIIGKVNLSTSTDLLLYLEALGRITIHKRFVKVVLPIVMKYCSGTVDEANAALHCLRDVLEKQESNEKLMIYLIEDLRAVNVIVDWLIQNVTSISVEQHRQLLENISVVLCILVGFLTKQEQEALLGQRIPQLIRCYEEFPSAIYIAPLGGLILRIHRDISVQKQTIDLILKITFKGKCNYVSYMCIELLANIVNKAADHELLNVYLNTTETMCTELLATDTNENINGAANLVSWIAKALLMRNHPQTSVWIDKLLQLVESYEEATMGPMIIMRENENSLSTKSRSNVQLFYRQKFFIRICEKLNEMYPNINNNHLVAFGCLLKETPHQILLAGIEKAFKIMLLCLENCTISDALCCTCETLLKLIVEIHPRVEEHISDLLPRLLKLTTFKPSMKVRMAALRCLRAFTTGYPIYKLIPHKQNVVFELAASLDDPKRLVRKEAVETRSRWFLVDAPI